MNVITELLNIYDDNFDNDDDNDLLNKIQTKLKSMMDPDLKLYFSYESDDSFATFRSYYETENDIDISQYLILILLKNTFIYERIFRYYFLYLLLYIQSFVSDQLININYLVQ